MFEYSITNKHYHTLDFYFKSKYKKKVFKVPLNASFTCPNRDGTKSTGGCLFCSALGSGDFAGNPKDNLLIQFETVKNNILKKWKDAYYIVYFQAFSNTYGNIEKLKENFEIFINKENVIGMSIATRCDCINKENVAYLKELKKHFKEFYVELGLQSSNDKTKEMLNLCYTNKDFKKATKLLKEAEIDIIVHIIDGLPYETKEDMLNTILFVNDLKVKGIKIHNLNIIENTKLAKMYLDNKFSLLTKDEYIDIVASQISILDESIIVHRIGADSNESDLIAPLWVKEKLSVMDKIDMYLENNIIFQGENYK